MAKRLLKQARTALRNGRTRSSHIAAVRRTNVKVVSNTAADGRTAGATASQVAPIDQHMD